MPQRFCVPDIWQLISNELFSAQHKKSSYKTKSGCFIHTGRMIVGLTLRPPPLITQMLCCPLLPQLFLKQRQQASGTKELLTKCKVIPQLDRCRQRVRLEASSWWSVQLSPGNVLSFICLTPCCSRMNFTQWPRFMKTRVSSVLTRARLRTWLSSHQRPVMFGVRTASAGEWDEGFRTARLLSNITPKTDGYD